MEVVKLAVMRRACTSRNAQGGRCAAYNCTYSKCYCRNHWAVSWHSASSSTGISDTDNDNTEYLYNCYPGPEEKIMIVPDHQPLIMKLYFLSFGTVDLDATEEDPFMVKKLK